MIKEVSLHMAFFCISVCISVPPQSIYVALSRNSLFSITTVLKKKKESAFFTILYSFGYSQHIYVLACSVCVCGFDCNEY